MSVLCTTAGSIRGEPANEEEKQRKVMVNRLLYRARQRGFLELDLLVGLWAERNIPLMKPDALAAFSEVRRCPLPWHLFPDTLYPTEVFGAEPSFNPFCEVQHSGCGARCGRLLKEAGPVFSRRAPASQAKAL